MATVLLGNTSPVEVPEGTQVHVNDEQVGGEKGEQSSSAKTIVLIETPDEDSQGNKIGLVKQLTEIRNAFQVHSEEGSPAWVESADEAFAKHVAEEFGVKVGRPDDWDPKEEEPEERVAEEPKDES